MAEIWGAAIVAGASLYGASKNASAGKAAANAQVNAANQANAEQAREYDQSRADQQPWLQSGQNALNLENQYLSGDTSGFQNSPDYQYAVQQGTKQLDSGATAHGNLWGGGADADRISLGQGLATQYANNYWNKISGMAGNGQQTANNLANLGQNYATNVGNNLGTAAQARSSSYANTANSWNNAANQIGNIAGQYYQQNGGWAPSGVSTGSYGGYIGGNGTGGYGMQLQTPSTSPTNFGYNLSAPTFG